MLFVNQEEGEKKDEKEEVINDIAAQALSLQPKGYTLETTEVSFSKTASL